MPGKWSGLRPITTLAEIHQGDVIVVEGCRSCNRPHVHVVGESPMPGLFFTTGGYHKSKTGCLDVRPALREQRLKRPEPGARLEELMRGDLPGGYP